MSPKADGTRVAVDIAIFMVREGRLKVLLVKRGVPPFQGRWALPGGFLKEDEGLDDAAPPVAPLRRAEDGRAFGDDGPLPVAGGDAQAAAWFDAYEPPPLAFDHSSILDYARQRLRWKLDWTTVGFGLVPSRFTLTELQRVFEAVLGKRIDKRNFRRKVLALGVLRPTAESRTKGLTRPAKLFEFSAARFERLRERGVLFPF